MADLTRSRRPLGELQSFVAVAVGVAVVNWSAALVLRWDCPLRTATGIMCPGCGATHALAAIVDGDLDLAFRSNALVLLLPLLAVAVSIGPESVRNRLRGEGLARYLLLLLTLFFVVRNLPGFSFLSLR